VSARKQKRNEAYLADLQIRLEQRAERGINRQLAQFDSETEEGKKEYQAFIDRLAERRKGLTVEPEFTSEVVGICKQILAFGAALLGLLIAFFPRLTELSSFWRSMLGLAALLTLDLTAISFLVLIWFFVQARSRYPFLYLNNLGNAPPFFYYETLSRRRPYSPIPSKRGVVHGNKFYLADLVKFGDTLIRETKDLRLRARHELQQYYLLIVYQGYLDQYEMQLVHIFVYGSLASVAASILTWFLVLR
jgi:hypothetical protein